MKRLKAAPVRVSVLLLTDIGASREILIKIMKNAGAMKCCRRAISGELSAKELKRLLPILCEHSEAVCLGNWYRELYREHLDSG